MAEWLKAHAWKACLGETLTRVRIPVSPPFRIDFTPRADPLHPRNSSVLRDTPAPTARRFARYCDSRAPNRAADATAHRDPRRSETPACLSRIGDYSSR